ncbi:MAG: ABC transporter ATP-binding protein [Deltaproteobacteria bacterium]|nr:ABC transporter ATP-binding protein [Deltaproteobacteria bacterium]
MKKAADPLLLKVKDLVTTFTLKGKKLVAVDHVSFDLRRGQILGIVGESGCGKTVTSLSLMRLVDAPGKIESGEVFLFTSQEEQPALPVDLLKLNEEKMCEVRGAKIAMIFQEPMTSLNPVYTVGQQIMEAIILHQKVNKGRARELAIEMLTKVKIPDPERRIDDYPHQMSGGMRQRVMIAMALSCHPDILIADEPTTALDVTVQAQILQLIRELVAEMGMAVILITHDLGVVSQICDEVLVMYAGMVVEQAPVGRLLSLPKHPYTLGLLHSIPTLRQKTGTLASIPGKVPDLAELPEGCRFADRCFNVSAACHLKVPSEKYVGEGQNLRCLNY